MLAVVGVPGSKTSTLFFISREKRMYSPRAATYNAHWLLESSQEPEPVVPPVLLKHQYPIPRVPMGTLFYLGLIKITGTENWFIHSPLTL